MYFLLGVLIFINFSASGLETPNQVITKIQNNNWHWHDTDMFYGYNSFKSCQFLNGNNGVIFKHYCKPKKDLPAKGFTYASNDSGVIYFYEEKINGLKSKSVTLEVEPNDLIEFGKPNYLEWKIFNWSELFEFFESKNHLACWASINRLNDQEVSSGCVGVEKITKNLSEIIKNWLRDAVSFVKNDQKWEASIKVFEKVTLEVPLEK